MLIGCSGYARSGKDTVAKILEVKYGFQHLAFADTIREALWALDPIVTSEEHSKPGTYSLLALRDYFDIYDLDWSNYREKGQPAASAEIRRLLQRLGTEAGRDLLGENIWINVTLAKRNSNKAVVTDLRFLNEALAIRGLDGKLIRVSRPGVLAVNNHYSETALDDFEFDHLIENDGSLEDLKKKVDRFANEVGLTK